MEKFSVMIPRIFHAAIFGYYMFVTFYWLRLSLPDNMNISLPSLKYSWWQYLTVWNVIIQGFNVALFVVHDVLQIGSTRKILIGAKEKLEWAMDTMFQSLTLPLSMCVFVAFWTVFSYDRELIYPSAIDIFIPFWFNHVLHTAVVFIPWAEMSLFPRSFEKLKTRYLYGMAVMVLYNVVLIGAACWQGYWTYPFLGVMTPVQKILYFLLMYCMYTTTYTIGCKANEKLCGKISRDSDGAALVEQRFEIVHPPTTPVDQVIIQNGDAAFMFSIPFTTHFSLAHSKDLDSS